MARTLSALTLPRRHEEVSPEWLTQALRAGSVLASGRVKSFEKEILGEGEGFVGTIVRFRLALEEAEADAPATVIGKFPITVSQNRGLGESLGAYEREIRFYNELAPQVPMRIPRLYYADMDVNPMAGREEQVMRFLDRFPDWLVRLLLPLAEWAARLSRRRYVLLLEDLAPAAVGDQVAGCGPELAGVALREVAKTHAAFWNRVDVPELSWVWRMEWLKRWFLVVYRQSWPRFVENHGTAHPRLAALAPWLDLHAEAVVDRLAALPMTLIHGDYRLDNMTLHDTGDGVSITTFDWQSPTRAPGVIDLAYFLGGSLAPADAREHAADLLSLYHEALCEGGVRDYSLAEVRAGHDLAQLWIAWRLMMGFDRIELAGRGQDLINAWLTRIEAQLPEDYEALFD